MKQLIILLVGAFSLTIHGLYGQSTTSDAHRWLPPYRLKTPAGWSTERFPIPIRFAPQIPYRGHEDVRFTPGWANAKSEEYWSYLYVWWLEGSPTITQTSLEKNLTDYYTGLVNQNSKTNRPGAPQSIPLLPSA